MTNLVARSFDRTKYDICFTSPLKRALDTTKILVSNLKIICDKRVLVITHAGVIYAVQIILGLEIKLINNLEPLNVEI